MYSVRSNNKSVLSCTGIHAVSVDSGVWTDCRSRKVDLYLSPRWRSTTWRPNQRAKWNNTICPAWKPEPILSAKQSTIALNSTPGLEIQGRNKRALRQMDWLLGFFLFTGYTELCLEDSRSHPRADRGYTLHTFSPSGGTGMRGESPSLIDPCSSLYDPLGIDCIELSTKKRGANTMHLQTWAIIY